LNLTWSKLPLKAKKAAETLGWTEEQWNTEKWTDLEDYWYEDLSAEQKAATVELGWDAAAWDGQYEAGLVRPARRRAEGRQGTGIHPAYVGR